MPLQSLRRFAAARHFCLPWPSWQLGWRLLFFPGVFLLLNLRLLRLSLRLLALSARALRQSVHAPEAWRGGQPRDLALTSDPVRSPRFAFRASVRIYTRRHAFIWGHAARWGPGSAK